MRRRDQLGRNAPCRRRRGAAALEAAFILPLFVTMLLGTLELGRAFEARGIIANAARQAARMASTGRYDRSTINVAVTAYVKQAFYPNKSSGLSPQLTIQSLDRTLTDPRQMGPNERVRVTVSIPYRDVLLTRLFFSQSSPTPLSISTVWGSASDPNAATP